MVNGQKDRNSSTDSKSKDQDIEVPDRGEATVETTEKPPSTRHERPHRRRPAPPVPDAESREGE
jgi:hypothetical protein